MRGIELIEESIAIGRELGTTELLRAMNNLAHQYQWHRGFDAMRPVVAELNATSEQFGYEEWIRWARDKKVTMQYHVGEWAGMRELLSELLAEPRLGDDALSRRIVVPLSKPPSSTPRDISRRPSTTLASASSLAREAGDPQATGPLLAWNTRLGSEELFDELLALFREAGTVLGPPTLIPDAAAAAVALGREETSPRS